MGGMITIPQPQKPFTLSKLHFENYDPIQCIMKNYILKFSYLNPTTGKYFPIFSDPTNDLGKQYQLRVNLNSPQNSDDMGEEFIYIPQTKQIRHKTKSLVWTVYYATYNTAYSSCNNPLSSNNPPPCNARWNQIGIEQWSGCAFWGPQQKRNCGNYFIVLDTPLSPSNVNSDSQKFDLSFGSGYSIINTNYKNKAYNIVVQSDVLVCNPDDLNRTDLTIPRNTDLSIDDDPLFSIDFQSVAGNVKATYDRSKITNWDTLNKLVALNFSNWETTTKRINDSDYQDIANIICANTTETVNPLNSTLPCKQVCSASGKCDGLNNFCKLKMVDWTTSSAIFSGCREHVIGTQYKSNNLNTEFQDTFRSSCNTVFNTIGTNPSVTLSPADSTKLKKCSCYPNDAVKDRYFTEIKKELNSSAATLLTNNGPIKCWFPTCNQNTDGLPEPNNSACPPNQIQICINQVQLNNTGTINQLNIDQNNNCSQYLNLSKDNTPDATIGVTQAPDTGNYVITPEPTLPPMPSPTVKSTEEPTPTPSPPPPPQSGATTGGYSTYKLLGGAFVIGAIVIIILQSLGLVVLWKKTDEIKK